MLVQVKVKQLLRRDSSGTFLAFVLSLRPKNTLSDNLIVDCYYRLQQVICTAGRLSLKGHVARAERLRIDGIDLAGQPSLAGSSSSSSRASYCGSTEDSAYSVLPKCAELERMCSQYRASITERRDTILRSADLHRKIEQVSCDHSRDNAGCLSFCIFL